MIAEIEHLAIQTAGWGIILAAAVVMAFLSAAWIFPVLNLLFIFIRYWLYVRKRRRENWNAPLRLEEEDLT